MTTEPAQRTAGHDDRPTAPGGSSPARRAGLEPARARGAAVGDPALLRHPRDDGRRHQPGRGRARLRHARAHRPGRHRQPPRAAGPTTRRTTARSSSDGRCRRTSSGCYGVRYDPATEILITVGASEAVDLALRATCDPGDEVIVHEPSYVSYVPADHVRRRRRAPRGHAARGRLRPRPGGGRGGDHAADQGALPRLPVQPDRRGPARPTSRTSWPRSPSATTCSSTATRSTTASPTARTRIGR